MCLSVTSGSRWYTSHLSTSYSFNMLAHLVVPVSCLPFTVASHSTFAASCFRARLWVQYEDQGLICSTPLHAVASEVVKALKIAKQCWTKWGCETTVKIFGTPNLSRCIASANFKSDAEKCQLYTYCPRSFLASRASVPTAERCIKMKPENTEMKVLFPWLVSYDIFLLPGELHLLHKLFTVCYVDNNILVKNWFLLNPT